VTTALAANKDQTTNLYLSLCLSLHSNGMSLTSFW
jgi:hypothetical protein